MKGGASQAVGSSRWRPRTLDRLIDPGHQIHIVLGDDAKSTRAWMAGPSTSQRVQH
ncbi:hypothetical protein AB0M44_00325 [Streptosporangium subroseum]|uniref:hypothetical protein n=1 Tax=Streptosporangium subroseum TaxID=106412 RepID=UPI00341E988C